MRILPIKGHGEDWCHGECLWTEETCVSVEVEEGSKEVEDSSKEVEESSPVMKREESSAGVSKQEEISGAVNPVNCGAHHASSCEECPQVIIIENCVNYRLQIVGNVHM